MSRSARRSDAITRDEMNELLLDLWQQYTKNRTVREHIGIREAVFSSPTACSRHDPRRPATIGRGFDDNPFGPAAPAWRSARPASSTRSAAICAERIEESHYPRARGRRAAPAAGATGARRMTAETQGRGHGIASAPERIAWAGAPWPPA